MVELGSKLALLKMPIRKWPPTRHQQNKTTTNKQKSSWGRKWHPSVSSPFQSSGVVCPYLFPWDSSVSRTTPHFPRLSRTWTKAVFFTVSWGRERVRVWHDSFAYIHVCGNEEVACMKSLCASKREFMTVELVTERRPCEPQQETWYFLSGSERQWRLLSSFFIHNL